MSKREATTKSELAYALTLLDHERVRAAKEAIRRVLTELSIPEPGEVGDFVLVPREPTEKMVKAGWSPALYNMGLDSPLEIYRAMIAAAPPTPKPREGGINKFGVDENAPNGVP